MEKLDPADTLNGNDVLEFAQHILANFEFEKFTDSESVWFSYNLVRWLAETFDRGSQLGVYSDEVAGESMPESIKPMLYREWKHGPYYLDGNILRLSQDDYFDYVQPVIPGWDEMMDKRLTLEQMLKNIKSSPEILANIEFAKRYCYDGVKVSFSNRELAKFGIEYKLRFDEIRVYPFGDLGGTESVTNYVLSNFSRLRLLAKTTAELSLLAVSHSDNIRLPVHRDRIEQLIRRLEGIEAITPAHMKIDPAPGGLRELAITQLVESGHLPIPL